MTNKRKEYILLFSGNGTEKETAMAKMQMNKDLVESAVLGASVLGGGGGSEEGAIEAGELALKIGTPVLLDVDDLEPWQTVVSCSMVTCPYRKDPFIAPRARVRSVELLLESGIGRPAGLIPNECGSFWITNGWIESAILGIPLVDAPCNGRGHPTPEMGSMGLHRVPDYVSIQSFAGGNPAKGAYVEGVLKGSIEMVSNMIRQDACIVGGIMAVARNPVEASYIRDNAAPGALKQAIRIGDAMKKAREKGPGAVIEAAASMLSGIILHCGEIETVDRFTAGGMDTGTVSVGGYEITFWKEYMTLEKDGERVATFPDLINIFSCETGRAVSSDLLLPGMQVALVSASRRELILGGGMRSPELFEPAETILGKEILTFLHL
jgi:DUF917 family protein